MDEECDIYLDIKSFSAQLFAEYDGSYYLMVNFSILRPDFPFSIAGGSLKCYIDIIHGFKSKVKPTNDTAAKDAVKARLVFVRYAKVLQGNA
jgi:hypothetical protein